MKKNFSYLVILAFAIMSLISCSKKDDVLNVPVKKEQVKIFMSAPNGQTGLKSASTADSIKRTPIANGDTVNVYDLKDVNIIISSEDENGNVSVNWWVRMIDNDFSYLNDGLYLLNQPNVNSDGSSISLKLRMLGLYQVNIKTKSGTEQHFFIRHFGIPGEVGDDWQNDYSFRLEKNLFHWYDQNSSDSKRKKAYSLFLKHYRGEFGEGPFYGDYNPNSEDNLHAFVYAQNQTLSISGNIWNAKIYKVKRCKYSLDYVSFTFLDEDIIPSSGMYELFFYVGDIEKSFNVLPSVDKSDWKRQGLIVFKVF